MRMALMGSCIRITFDRSVGETLGDMTLLERNVSLGSDFVVSKTGAIPSVSLLASHLWIVM